MIITVRQMDRNFKYTRRGNWTFLSNLKKYLKLEQERAKSGTGELAFMAVAKSVLQNLFQASMTHRNLNFHFRVGKKNAP